MLGGAKDKSFHRVVAFGAASAVAARSVRASAVQENLAAAGARNWLSRTSGPETNAHSFDVLVRGKYRAVVLGDVPEPGVIDGWVGELV